MQSVEASALKGVRVLDLSRILAGPSATQLLGDLGADVVKVEKPDEGDDTRKWGPPYINDQDGHATAESAYYLSANRNKRSIAIDIATTAGRETLHQLLDHADVLVENYKVGTLARYGLDYDSLRAINPRLIYCSITGFGQDGPYAPLPGYDFVFQGMGGLMSITGDPAGEPMKSGIAITDLLTGVYASTAILAAVEHRHVSGVGQYIDMSLLDCVITISSYQAINYFLSGRVPQRMGNAHSNMVPYQVFACKEGSVIVAVGNDGQYRALCGAIGRADLAADERYATAGGRNRNRDTLIPPIAEAMLARTMQEWVQILQAANVPCGPIYNIEQVFQDPHVRHRGMQLSLPHAAGVDTPAVANPIRMRDTPIRYGRAAPTLGQHTDDVLSERLGLDQTRIAELKGRGII